ncbi:tRNA1(Val) (adenine(37)-N6)-methyltransferase [Guggenheimella bovis]
MKYSDENREELNNNRFIYQKKTGFRFGIDSVLLAHFVDSKGKVLELGSGTGIISILLADRVKELDAIEIQADQAEMSMRTVSDNGLSNIRILEGDFMKIDSLVSKEDYDAVVSNPPYYKHTIQSPKPELAISRHEVMMNLRGLVEAASFALKPKGVFYLVYHVNRMDELFLELERLNFRVKRIRLVYPKKTSEANLVLVKAVKGGGRELRIDPPLIVYEGAKYTEEIERIYDEVQIERNE